MPLVSSSIANLVNGVSQQPYTLRLASQAELQENGLSTVAQGLKKRPPTKHVKKVSASVGQAYIHTINRDAVERYTVIITNGDLKVYDTNGVQKTVNFPSGKAYLNSASPRTGFRAVTVADYTFVVNRGTTVALSGAIKPARPFEGLIIVKNGLYSKNYKVSINGTSAATYATPDGSATAHVALVATDYIANQLTTQINASGLVTAVQHGSTIYLTKVTDFAITTSDGYSDSAMYAVKGQIQRFSDLPANAGVQDFTVEIVGDKTSSFDNYWVRFDMSAGGAGVWRETLEPGIPTGLLPTTMPWALVRQSDGTFTFNTLSYALRSVGDEDSAPHPSFLGRAIQDIFFYRNRLGFIADESVVFSEAGEFFNFYPTTVTDLLDSERIDVQVSHTKVSNLIAAVPFSKQLLLFSEQTQFTVESGDLLTPRTISIKPTTEFECSPLARPQGIGRVVYFAVPKGPFTGMREYFVDETSNTNDAADVTSHVPQYVPQGIFKLAVGLNEDILVALSSVEPNVLYVYKFYWNNNEKLQSSWSKWTFPATDSVLNVDFIQSSLNILINRADGLYLETLNVSDVVDYTNEPYLVHLDRKQTIPKASLSFVSPYTIITPAVIGWSPTDGEYATVGAANQGNETGVLRPVVWDGVNAKVLGDFTGADLVLGRKYAFRYKFSTIVPKSKTRSGAEQADNIARLQLRNMQVNYSDTGYFEARVTPQGRPTYTYKFTGKNLGLLSSTIGAINLETGSFRFPVLSQNTTVDIELFSDSPLPSSFLSADWEGFYVKRSQGI